jgi:hypothetical protein
MTMDNASRDEIPRHGDALVQELIAYLTAEGIAIHGARNSRGFRAPSPVANNGYGDGRPKTPDIVGVDDKRNRIVFGVVRPDRASLDSENSLTEYNVFLDHREDKGDAASVLYVMIPPPLQQDFNSIITHYIHREYWHRIVTVVSGKIR